MEKFCPVCQSWLNDLDERVVDGVKTAVHLCSKCGYTKPLDKNNPLVYEHILREDKTTRLSMNPNIKYDLTLPRFNNITCSNPDCPSKSGAEPNVVGMKIDQQRLIWMYQCVNCDLMWKQASRAS